MKTKSILSVILAFVSVTLCAQTWKATNNVLHPDPLRTTKIGIGLRNPSEMFQIDGGAIKIGHTTAPEDRARNLLKFGDGSYVQLGEWEGDDILSFKAERYSFTGGNVGIGTNNATNKLEVKGTTSTEKLLIARTNDVTDWDSIWKSGFYDGKKAANAPGDSLHYWGIHIGYRQLYTNQLLAAQIAIDNSENPDMYFRSIGFDGKSNWRQVMTQGGMGKMILDTEERVDGWLYSYLQWPGHSLVMGSPVGAYNHNSIDLRPGGVKQEPLFSQIRMYTATGENQHRLDIQLNSNGDCFFNMPGNVGIGTDNPEVKLDVAGTVRAHEVRVCLDQGCDYVFAPDYKLLSLSELEQFVNTNRHLPEVAPAAEMEAGGIELSEMNALLLKKVEELTLHVIELNKRIEVLENGDK